MTKYMMEVFTTENVATKVKRYYKVVCGVGRRISKADYQKLEDNAEGACCFSTVNTKTHIKQYKTLEFYTDLVL